MSELATLPSLPRQGAASGKDLAAAYIDGGNSNASDDRQEIEVTEPRPGLAPGSRPRTGRRRMSAIADNLTGRTSLAGNTNTADGRPCKLAAILAGLDNIDRDAVNRALHTPIVEGGASDERVSLALKHVGPVSVAAVRRHRLHLCGCTTIESETVK